VGEENIFTDIVSLCGTCHKKLHRGDPDIMRKAQVAIYKR
jgi:predicted HNH restriction endonuclease